MIEINEHAYYWVWVEVMEKSWVTEIQEDRLSHEIVQFCSFKKQTGTFYITKVLGLGQLRP